MNNPNGPVIDVNGEELTDEAIQRGIDIVNAGRRLHDACEKYHYGAYSLEEFIQAIKINLHVLTKDTPVPKSLLFKYVEGSK